MSVNPTRHPQDLTVIDMYNCRDYVRDSIADLDYVYNFTEEGGLRPNIRYLEDPQARDIFIRAIVVATSTVSSTRGKIYGLPEGLHDLTEKINRYWSVNAVYPTQLSQEVSPAIFISRRLLLVDSLIQAHIQCHSGYEYQRAVSEYGNPFNYPYGILDPFSRLLKSKALRLPLTLFYQQLAPYHVDYRNEVDVLSELSLPPDQLVSLLMSGENSHILNLIRSYIRHIGSDAIWLMPYDYIGPSAIINSAYEDYPPLDAILSATYLLLKNGLELQKNELTYEELTTLVLEKVRAKESSGSKRRRKKSSGGIRSLINRKTPKELLIDSFRGLDRRELEEIRRHVYFREMRGEFSVQMAGLSLMAICGGGMYEMPQLQKHEVPSEYNVRRRNY